MRPPLASLAAIALLACASAGRERSDRVRRFAGVGVERVVAAALPAMGDAGTAVVEVRWDEARAAAVVRGVTAAREPGAPVLALEVAVGPAEGGVVVSVAAEPWEPSAESHPAAVRAAGERPCPCGDPLVPTGGGWDNLQALARSRRTIQIFLAALDLRMR